VLDDGAVEVVRAPFRHADTAQGQGHLPVPPAFERRR
jgi:hypothetical protein